MEKLAALIGLEMLLSVVCALIALSDWVKSGSRTETILMRIFYFGWLTPPIGGAMGFCVWTLLK